MIKIGTPEWHQERMKRIGASEIASLFGVRYGITPWQLFMQKTGQIAPPDLSNNPDIIRGQCFEPAIAKWAEATWSDFRPLEPCDVYFPHPKIPGLGASLDYTVYDHELGNLIPVEIKSVRFLIWREQYVCDGETIITAPLDRELQLQQQISCLTAPYGWLVICVGGDALYRVRRPARQTTIEIIEAKAVEFWDRVARNDPPPQDYENDSPAIAKLFANRATDVTIDLTTDNRIAQLCTDLEQARADKKSADDREGAAKAEILAKLGTASAAMIPGGGLLTAKIQSRAEYVCKASSFPVIRLPKSKKAK